jgi:hypothetical protein
MTTQTEPKKLTLYDVGVEGAEIERLLIEADGELTPEIEARLDAHLAGGKNKIVAAAMVVRMLEASAATCDAEAKRLKDRAASFENQVAVLKARMLFAVDAGFNGKLKTDLFTIWGQTSASTTSFDLAPDADIAKVAETRPGLVCTTLALDKQLIASEYKLGVELPPEIVATEKPGTRFLRIK